MTDNQTDARARPTRRAVLAAAATAAVAGSGRALAEGDRADFLFVQTAKGMTFDAETKTLTLVGVAPTTLFFSDRPERIAGNMRTADFVPFWSEGADSFLSDPPNADVSILEGGELKEAVVVLMDPRLDGADLAYTVKMVEGELPASAEEVSLFIDVIGMPLTPVSFAGRRRRMYRRAVMLR